jgi:phosphate-selective porin OprO/OprP
MFGSFGPFGHVRSKVFNAARIGAVVVAGTIVPSLASAQAPAPTDQAAPSAAPAEAAPAPTAAPAAPALPPGLLDRIDEIDQRSRIVDRKLELAEEAAAAKKKEAPTVSADEKGFSLGSADGAFQLKLRGLVQFDGRRVFDATDPTIPDKDTFIARRIRPIFDGTILGLVDFRISPDFGNNATVLTDAYLDAHPKPWLRLRAGKFKGPVGLERLQADNNVVLIERSLDSNLSSQREVGVQLWGDIASGFLRYELGVYNGVPDGTLLDTDIDHSKTYAGRIFLRPFQLGDLKSFGDLGLGIAVSTGTEKGNSALVNGAASNTWLPSFRTAGQNTIYSYVSSTTDVTQTVFALKRHTRVNPQLYYYNGPVGVLAEWVKEYQELGKGTGAGALNHQAGHVTASIVIGGDNTYDGVKPKKPANWATGDIGAIELAARYNWINLDDLGFANNGVFADKYKSVTAAKGFGVGANWWLNRNLKLSANWEQTSFTGGNSTGTGAAKVVSDRTTEKVLIGRFQVAF